MTQQIVVRPVTSTGRPAAGFAVMHTYRHSAVDCGDGSGSSPGAVDPNIDYCSPSAAYAIACWKAPAPHRILCLQRFASHRLVRFRDVHGYTKVAPPSRSDLAPLKLVLSRGVTCSIRDGGAWGRLSGRPKWFGSYSCSNGRVVWQKLSMSHYGVNESSASWTVHLGPGGGKGKLVVRNVLEAYFVGTAS